MWLKRARRKRVSFQFPSDDRSARVTIRQQPSLRDKGTKGHLRRLGSVSTTGFERYTLAMKPQGLVVFAITIAVLQLRFGSAADNRHPSARGETTKTMTMDGKLSRVYIIFFFFCFFFPIHRTRLALQPDTNVWVNSIFFRSTRLDSNYYWVPTNSIVNRK